jgi:uncharacterized membrane protein
MTNTTSTEGRPETGAPSTYNVIAVAFEDDVNAYGALTKLKELDAQDQIGVQEGVVVRRAADGSMAVKDRVGSAEPVGTAAGGLTGLLVGILGGPLGMLVGGSTGLLVGSLFDLDGADQVETALGEISKTVQPEHTAVLAVVAEPSSEIIDAAMVPFGGTVLRRNVYEVEAEVAAIEKAEQKAAREAQLELLRSKRDSSREAVHSKVEKLKAKLGRRDAATTSGASTETG